MNANHPNERVVIVDENDRPIGSKLRKDRTPADIYRVSALWLTNSKDQVLLAQRGLTKDRDPGKWGPAVAGTVGANESYEDNIYKEAAEEIGVTGQTFQLGPKTLNERPGRYRLFNQWFTAELNWPAGQFTVQADEVEQVKWFDRDFLLTDIQEHPESYTFSAAGWKELFLSER